MNAPYLSKPAAVCAAGDSIEAIWDAAVNGCQKGIRNVSAYDGSVFFVGRIDDALLQPFSKLETRLIRIEAYALSFLEKEIDAARAKYGPRSIGVCVGSCDNGAEQSLSAHRAYFTAGRFPEGYALNAQVAASPVSFIQERYGVSGPALAFSTACSSSAGAIIKAAELLQADLCDAVIAGGVDVASDTALLGFHALEAISPEITNPFSKNRRGITLGEAAAFFVMTREPLREDTNPVRLLGYGESADAYHMTSPDPSGEGAANAMQTALQNAGLTARDIDYVNLHGTGTKFNDRMEASAVRRIFGEYEVSVSATKPITGHTLGAAGALEAAICYAAITENAKRTGASPTLPVQVWDGVQDAELAPLNIIDGNNTRTPDKVRVCMSNSFAFGGANASLIIGSEQGG